MTLAVDMRPGASPCNGVHGMATASHVIYLGIVVVGRHVNL